jgi:hypothetical protein
MVVVMPYCQIRAAPFPSMFVIFRYEISNNKARQIIKELAPTNPAYYEKLRERLEQIIEHSFGYR